MSSALNAASNSDPISGKTAHSPRQTALLWCGHLLVGLGFIGILLPIMPTTVFWIGAALCYAKSSPERYQRLVGGQRSGKVIRNYLEHGVISNKGKWAATLGMSFSATLLWLAPLNEVVTLASLLVLAAAVTYVVTRPGKVPATK